MFNFWPFKRRTWGYGFVCERHGDNVGNIRGRGMPCFTCLAEIAESGGTSGPGHKQQQYRIEYERKIGGSWIEASRELVK